MGRALFGLIILFLLIPLLQAVGSFRSPPKPWLIPNKTNHLLFPSVPWSACQTSSFSSLPSSLQSICYQNISLPITSSNLLVPNYHSFTLYYPYFDTEFGELCGVGDTLMNSYNISNCEDLFCPAPGITPDIFNYKSASVKVSIAYLHMYCHYCTDWIEKREKTLESWIRFHDKLQNETHWFYDSKAEDWKATNDSSCKFIQYRLDNKDLICSASSGKPMLIPQLTVRTNSEITTAFSNNPVICYCPEQSHVHAGSCQVGSTYVLPFIFLVLAPTYASFTLLSAVFIFCTIVYPFFVGRCLQWYRFRKAQISQMEEENQQILQGNGIINAASVASSMAEEEELVKKLAIKMKVWYLFYRFVTVRTIAVLFIFASVIFLAIEQLLQWQAFVFSINRSYFKYRAMFGFLSIVSISISMSSILTLYAKVLEDKRKKSLALILANRFSFLFFTFVLLLIAAGMITIMILNKNQNYSKQIETLKVVLYCCMLVYIILLFVGFAVADGIFYTKLKKIQKYVKKKFSFTRMKFAQFSIVGGLLIIAMTVFIILYICMELFAWDVFTIVGFVVIPDLFHFTLLALSLMEAYLIFDIEYFKATYCLDLCFKSVNARSLSLTDNSLL